VSLDVHLVTPEREVWSGTAQMLIAHGVDGEVGILAVGFLPAPHRVGGLFNRLLPAEQTALISAYRMAGIPEADLLNIIGRTGIRGRARTGTFTG